MDGVKYNKCSRILKILGYLRCSMDIEGGMLKQTHITAFILKGQVDIQNEKI